MFFFFFPNPFSGVVTISMTLPSGGRNKSGNLQLPGRYGKLRSMSSDLLSIIDCYWQTRPVTKFVFEPNCKRSSNLILFWTSIFLISEIIVNIVCR